MAFTFPSCLFRYLKHIRPILDFDYYRRGARPVKEGAFLVWSGGLMAD